MGDQQDGLASGVSEALITTAAGLCIGIPALIFYSLFRGRVQRLIAEMEAAATHLMALLSSQYKRASSRAAGRRSGPPRDYTSEVPPMQDYPMQGQDPRGL